MHAEQGICLEQRNFRRVHSTQEYAGRGRFLLTLDGVDAALGSIVGWSIIESFISSLWMRECKMVEDVQETELIFLGRRLMIPKLGMTRDTKLGLGLGLWGVTAG